MSSTITTNTALCKIFDLAISLDDLGVTFMASGEREGGTKNLNRSISYFSLALNVLEQPEKSYQKELIRYHLAAALRMKGERSSDNKRELVLNKSISEFEEAAEYFNQHKYFDICAECYVAMAHSFNALGYHASEHEAKSILQKSMLICENASKTISKEGSPHQWAELQHVWAISLALLGEHSDSLESRPYFKNSINYSKCTLGL